MNINKIIEKFEEELSTETTANMTSEQSYYLVGISDGLEIVKSCMDDYNVGQNYFVLMPDGEDSEQIIEMRLYKITHKVDKTFYSFSTDLNANNKSPQRSLTLSNDISLQLRVYHTLEEAQQYANNLWRFYNT